MKQDQRQKKQKRKRRGEAHSSGNPLDLIAFLAVLATAGLLIIMGDVSPEALSAYMMACGAALLGWRRISRK